MILIDQKGNAHLLGSGDSLEAEVVNSWQASYTARILLHRLNKTTVVYESLQPEKDVDVEKARKKLLTVIKMLSVQLAKGGVSDLLKDLGPTFPWED